MLPGKAAAAAAAVEEVEDGSHWSMQLLRPLQLLPATAAELVGLVEEETKELLSSLSVSKLKSET